MAKRKSITSRSKPRGYSSLAAQQICHLDDMMQDGLGMLHGLMGQANRRLKVRDETDTVMPLAVQQQINVGIYSNFPNQRALIGQGARSSTERPAFLFHQGIGDFPDHVSLSLGYGLFTHKAEWLG